MGIFIYFKSILIYFVIEDKSIYQVIHDVDDA